MAEDDLQIAHAGNARGFNIFLIAHREHCSARRTRKHRHIHEADGEHQHHDALPKRRHDRDAEQHARDAGKHLAHAQNQVFRKAAVVACDQPKGTAQHTGDRHGHDAHRKGIFCAVKHAGQHIAPILVRSKRVLRARRLEAFFNVLLNDVRIVIVYKLRNDCHNDNDDKHNKANHRARALFVIAPDLAEHAALFVLLQLSCGKFSFDRFHSIHLTSNSAL